MSDLTRVVLPGGREYVVAYVRNEVAQVKRRRRDGAWVLVWDRTWWKNPGVLLTRIIREARKARRTAFGRSNDG